MRPVEHDQCRRPDSQLAPLPVLFGEVKLQRAVGAAFGQQQHGYVARDWPVGDRS